LIKKRYKVNSSATTETTVKTSFLAIGKKRCVSLANNAVSKVKIHPGLTETINPKTHLQSFLKLKYPSKSKYKSAFLPLIKYLTIFILPKYMGKTNIMPKMAENSSNFNPAKKKAKSQKT
jgi:hypothetical protein